MKKSFLIYPLLCVFLMGVPVSAAYLMDLPEDNWSYPYASTLVDKGIMTTDDYGNFNPDIPTSRGEFILALWNAFNSPEPIWTGAPTFDDVGPTSPYLLAVEWAVNNEITSGISSTQLGPDLNLTREQAFTFLYRAMNYLGVAPVYGDGHEQLKQITEFNDYWNVSDWAADSVQLLLDAGIVSGSDTGHLWPKQDVNNAATAAILYRSMDYMGLLN